MRRRHFSVLCFAGNPVKSFEHSPAHGQSRIDVDRAQQRRDGVRRVLKRDVTEPALLMLKAESRPQTLKRIKKSQGFAYAVQVAVCARGKQQEIAVFRKTRQQL